MFIYVLVWIRLAHHTNLQMINYFLYLAQHDWLFQVLQKEKDSHNMLFHLIIQCQVQQAYSTRITSKYAYWGLFRIEKCTLLYNNFYYKNCNPCTNAYLSWTCLVWKEQELKAQRVKQFARVFLTFQPFILVYIGILILIDVKEVN